MTNHLLENTILGLVNKAKKLINSNTELGQKYLRQAITLYHEMDKGDKSYIPQIEHALNPVCISYMDYL